MDKDNLGLPTFEELMQEAQKKAEKRRKVQERIGKDMSNEGRYVLCGNCGGIYGNENIPVDKWETQEWCEACLWERFESAKKGIN